MICAGIDAGSRLLKIVLWDPERREVVAADAVDQCLDHHDLAARRFEHLLRKAGRRRKDVSRIVATGYARNVIRMADATITEITCHARGIHQVAPHARTVIEIGGQDSKLLRLDHDGGVLDFAMNDRCAAGTGRFLEVVADRLKVKLQNLGKMTCRSKRPAIISSMCIVFAETEIIGLLAAGTRPADIVAGVQRSIATRIAAMTGNRMARPIVFTGGVALVPGMQAALASVLKHPVAIAPQPQFSGALGAAILASKSEMPPCLSKGGKGEVT
jgi:predicted CoA-substrate-specific enzyme activase